MVILKTLFISCLFLSYEDAKKLTSAKLNIQCIYFKWKTKKVLRILLMTVQVAIKVKSAYQKCLSYQSTLTVFFTKYRLSIGVYT